MAALYLFLQAIPDCKKQWVRRLQYKKSLAGHGTRPSVNFPSMSMNRAHIYCCHWHANWCFGFCCHQLIWHWFKALYRGLLGTSLPSVRQLAYNIPTDWKLTYGLALSPGPFTEERRKKGLVAIHTVCQCTKNPQLSLLFGELGRAVLSVES